MFSIEDLVSVTTLRKVIEQLNEDQQNRFLAEQRENEEK